MLTSMGMRRFAVYVWAVSAAAALAGGLVARADGPGAAPAPVSGLTLEQAIELALTRNERAQISELNIAVADAGVQKAKVAFLPVLSAAGSDTWGPFDKSPRDTAKGSLVLSQPLITPSAFPLYSQAKELLASQRAQTIDDKRLLAYDAAKAFFAVLLADKVVQAAQRKLETAKADVADTTAQFKAQLVSSNDVTRAQVTEADTERELASDSGALDAAYVALEFTINAVVARNLAEPSALLAAGQAPPGSPEPLIAQGLAHRPDLVARARAGEAAHDFAREPHMRFYPTVGISATAQAQSTTIIADGHDVDANIMLSAAWAIYDAGSRDADERSRNAQAEIADLTTATLRRTVDQEVRTAVAQLAAAQQAMGGAKDSMDAARKSADETKILYQQGLAKAIELVDANNDRFSAEVSYAEAEFTVATAYLALRQAIGLDPVGPETK
jgi:outer membrane protein TolC